MSDLTREQMIEMCAYLKRELDDLRENQQGAAILWAEAQNEIRRLQQEWRRLASALRFYANPGNYDEETGGPVHGVMVETELGPEGDSYPDFGQVAQAALRVMSCGHPKTEEVEVDELSSYCAACREGKPATWEQGAVWAAAPPPPAACEECARLREAAQAALEHLGYCRWVEGREDVVASLHRALAAAPPPAERHEW